MLPFKFNKDLFLKILLVVITVLTFIVIEQAAVRIAAGETEDNLFDRRHAVISFSSDDTSISTSAAVTLPIPQVNGGLYGEIQHATNEGVVISDEIDVRTEAGFSTSFLQVKAFVNGERSQLKQIDFKREVGGYIGTPVLSAGLLHAEFGAGSLFESVDLQKALDLETENAGRLLAFAKVSIGNIGATFDLTPTFNLKDLQVSVRPNLLYQLNQDVSLRFDARYDYSSNPYGGADNWIQTHSAGLDIEF